MSFCIRPIVAAKSAVAAPTVATTAMVAGASTYRKLSRAIMYTPAVTMVAAWINALTGVGPAIASGSHTYNGSCADFPVAPTNSSRVTAVTVAGERSCARAAISPKLNDGAPLPRFQKSTNRPSRNPASPMRLTTNAFFPALALFGS